MNCLSYKNNTIKAILDINKCYILLLFLNIYSVTKEICLKNNISYYVYMEKSCTQMLKNKYERNQRKQSINTL